MDEEDSEVNTKLTKEQRQSILAKGKTIAHQEVDLLTIFKVKYIKGFCGLCVRRPLCLDTEEEVSELYVVHAINRLEQSGRNTTH